MKTWCGVRWGLRWGLRWRLRWGLRWGRRWGLRKLLRLTWLAPSSRDRPRRRPLAQGQDSFEERLKKPTDAKGILDRWNVKWIQKNTKNPPPHLGLARSTSQSCPAWISCRGASTWRRERSSPTWVDWILSFVIFFQMPKMFGWQKFDEKSWELLFSLMDHKVKCKDFKVLKTFWFQLSYFFFLLLSPCR